MGLGSLPQNKSADGRDQNEHDEAREKAADEETEGHGDEDICSTIKVLEEMSGVKVASK